MLLKLRPLYIRTIDVVKDKFMEATTSDKTCWDTLQQYLFFCTHPDKNAYCCRLKDPVPPPLLQCCLRQHKKYMLELLSRNNITPGVGRGANLFLLYTMVPWREIENCIEMSQQFCPGLSKMACYWNCCIFAMEVQKIVNFGPVIALSMSFLTN